MTTILLSSISTQLKYPKIIILYASIPSLYTYKTYTLTYVQYIFTWYQIIKGASHDWSDLACMYALEKEMAAHSSILLWRIPGMEEPGGLQSMGSHRVRHDWSYLAAASASGSKDKESSWKAGGQGSIPGLARSTRGGNGNPGNGNPLQYFCLENPCGQSSLVGFKPHGHKELDVAEWLTFQFSSVQLLSHVRLFATPWTSTRQASLSITNSKGLLKLMSIESVMPSSHLILCRPLLLLPPTPPSQWANSLHEVAKVLEFSASASVLPMNSQHWFPLGWTGWISLQSKGLSRVFSNTTVQKYQFFGTQLSSQSNSHIHTWPLEKP